MLLVTTGSGDPLIDFVANGGAIGILAMLVVAFVRGWIVPGSSAEKQLEAKQSECERITLERDRALDIIYKQAEATSRALEVAEKVKQT